MINSKQGKEFIVDLNENGEAFIEKDSSQIQGQWTMVYDEGFQIDINGISFISFFKYYPVNEEEVSEQVIVDDDLTVVSHSKVTTYEFDCTETTVGWYTMQKNNKRGCMKAYKENPKEEDRHLRSQEKGNVVQPLDYEVNNFSIQDNFNDINSSDQDGILYDQQTSSSNLKKRKFNLQGTLNNILDNLGQDDNTSTQNSQQSEIDQLKIIKQNDDINLNKNAELNQNTHKNTVDQLNSLDKNWQAGISSSFQDLTLDEVNKKAGRNKRKYQKKNAKKKFPTDSEVFKEYQKDVEKMYKHFSIQDVSDLPKNFTWEEYIDDPIEQNDCGSCYIISTVHMLNARLKIKYGKDFNKKISMQHLLDCSFFSQGCDGGYPFELGRFGKDYFMVPENGTKFQVSIYCYFQKLIFFVCKNQKRMKQKSAKSKIQIKQMNILRQLNMGKLLCQKKLSGIFVGQQYGKGNEREMMLEIIKNGPIVANFKTGADFVYYKSGVYHSVQAADWILKCIDYQQNLTLIIKSFSLGQVKPEWRPVEHAVMCYGWGESEEDGKYWLMQNSWGNDWGEKGRFKQLLQSFNLKLIRRGTDESFVESSAEYAQVEFIQKNK